MPFLQGENAGYERDLWASWKRYNMQQHLQFKTVFEFKIKAASIISYNTSEVSSFLRDGCTSAKLQTVPWERTEDQRSTLTRPVVAGALAMPGLGLLLKRKAGLDDMLWWGKLPSSVPGKMMIPQGLRMEEIRANDDSRPLLPLKNSMNQ